MHFLSIASKVVLLGLGLHVDVAASDPITLTNSIINCQDVGKTSAVSEAVNRAIALATAARDSDLGAAWTAWFNRNEIDLCKVKSLMNRLANFDPEVYKTQFVCASPGDQSRCTEQQVGAVSVSPSTDPNSDGTWKVYLCDHFFYSIVPSLGCTKIAPVTKIHSSDRGGVILHELMHDDFLFQSLPWQPAHIQDGDGATCYTPKQITSQARGVDVPVCGDLLTTASAYEYYAYAAFALGDKSCNGPGYGGVTWGECKANHTGW